MKKLLLSLLLFPAFSFAQVWIDNGAVWHYDYWGIAEGGFVKVDYTGDTLIDGFVCQRIEAQHHQFAVTGPGGDIELISISDYPLQHTRVSGDTVFYRDNEEFFVLYNFGAVPGENWIISTTNLGGPFVDCDDTSRLEVIDTGKIDIGGTLFRYIDVQPTSNSGLGQVGRICERFGNMSYTGAHNEYLFPTANQCDSMDPGTIVEYYFYDFKCYEDNSFTLYNPSEEDCEYLLNIGIDENQLSANSYYPNPLTDRLTIEIDSDVKIESVELIDLLGRKVKIDFEENGNGLIEVQLAEFQSGAYYVRLKSTNSQTVDLKILKK